MSYTLIERKELTEAASSISFENIPQFYSDLYILVSSRSNGAFTSSELDINLNGSSSDFSGRYLYGSGSGVGSTTDTTMIGSSSAANNTANTFGNASIYIPNYTSSTAKSISGDGVGESNATTAYASIHAALWNQTAPITSITFKMDSGARNFVAGSSVSLYGINRQQAIGAPKALGGAISFANGHWYHAFTGSGTFAPQQNLDAEILLVAGGGSGAAGVGGAGGAGGVLGFASQQITGARTITIGAGGAITTVAGTAGSNGTDTTFSGLTSAIGGGGGGGYLTPRDGKAGGSGGGGVFSPPATVGGAGTSGQGFAGGAGGNAQSGAGGGAGGVGANGVNTSGTLGAAGGAATDTVTNLGSIISWLSATSTGVSGKIAGGGSSAGDAGPGAVQGGGGLGAAIFGVPYPNASPATANTGGGGGGGSQGTSGGGAGGSGIVIIRYKA
jgi:hypothetical protein